MDRILLSKDYLDTSLGQNIKNKLYELYGASFSEEIPRLLGWLIDTYNSDDFFTNLLVKRINDRKLKDESFKKIRLYLLLKLCGSDEETISKLNDNNDLDYIDNEETLKRVKDFLDDPKKKKYLDILWLMSKKLFERKKYDILRDYIVSREPIFYDCTGVNDLEQCDFIIERYHKFLENMGLDATPDPPIINEDGTVVISKGDLFHGTKYSEQVIESIAVKGLETGQLHGKNAGGETWLCIDFKKAEKDLTPDEACISGSSFANGPDQIVFVIRGSNVEGPNAICPELTDYDAYNPDTERGRKASEIVNAKALPLSHDTGAAILMGVPPCMISSIIVNRDIESDPKKIEFLSSHFPKAFIVGRTNGRVIRDPKNKVLS